MAETCDFQLGNMCFNPAKATNGVLAVPCKDCGRCGQQQPKATTITSIQAQLHTPQHTTVLSKAQL